jgi:hypothetical protein
MHLKEKLHISDQKRYFQKKSIEKNSKKQKNNGKKNIKLNGEVRLGY